MTQCVHKRCINMKVCGSCPKQCAPCSRSVSQFIFFYILLIMEAFRFSAESFCKLMLNMVYFFFSSAQVIIAQRTESTHAIKTPYYSNVNRNKFNLNPHTTLFLPCLDFEETHNAEANPPAVPLFVNAFNFNCF